MGDPMANFVYLADPSESVVMGSPHDGYIADGDSFALISIDTLRTNVGARKSPATFPQAIDFFMQSCSVFTDQANPATSDPDIRMGVGFAVMSPSSMALLSSVSTDAYGTPKISNLTFPQVSTNDPSMATDADKALMKEFGNSLRSSICWFGLQQADNSYRIMLKSAPELAILRKDGKIIIGPWAGTLAANQSWKLLSFNKLMGMDNTITVVSGVGTGGTQYNEGEFNSFDVFAQKRRLGEPCVAGTSPCESNLSCIDGVCANPPARIEGEACTLQYACASGLSCQLGTCKKETGGAGSPGTPSSTPLVSVSATSTTSSSPTGIILAIAFGLVIVIGAYFKFSKRKPSKSSPLSREEWQSTQENKPW